LTCFGHHLLIFWRHYTNAVLMSVVCGDRCGRTAHIYQGESEVGIKFVGRFVIHFGIKFYIPGLIGTSVTANRLKANTNIALLPH
jgi:hypothetical protein